MKLTKSWPKLKRSKKLPSPLLNPSKRKLLTTRMTTQIKKTKETMLALKAREFWMQGKLVMDLEKKETT